MVPPYQALGRRGFLSLSGTVAAACACGQARAQDHESAGHEPVPGAENSLKSNVLEMGAEVLQDDAPIRAINMYLNGFHFYADDMGRQIEAHHYCAHLTEDFFQCVIYDGNREDSRLIGIEYIVSERLFSALPAQEKPLWHSHRYEVTSGGLVMPGIPEPVERAAVATLASTYGKTWHTWQIDRDAALPLGIPQLMMGFTADGQLRPDMIEHRDAALGMDTEEVRTRRAELARTAPPPAAGADAWTSGTAGQLALTAVPFKRAP